jgi:D-alanine transaminase
VSRIAYVDGRYAPLHEPLIGVLDRGFQFSDAVYEVWPVREGLLVDRDGHLTRLARSLRELAIEPPMGDGALLAVVRETLRRNRVVNGIVYLQISRGCPRRRDHTFPRPGLRATLVVTAETIDPRIQEARAAKGIAAFTAPDNRWGRCDIKTVALLPNALARETAKHRGGTEALFFDADGYITEGAATNVFLVDAEGVLRTRDLSANILPGITRLALMEAAGLLQMRVEERAFSVAEALSGRELIVTSAGMGATAVVRLDDASIGAGAPGPVAMALRCAYFDAALRQARQSAQPLVAEGGIETL